MKIYRCNVCGNITELIHEGGGELVCCGQAMDLLNANTQDAATEKHVPVATYENGVVHVQVGSVEHPMLDEHWIEFIIVKAGDLVTRVDLKPGQKPAADLPVGDYKGTVEVYEFCNLHGLWKSELSI